MGPGKGGLVPGCSGAGLSVLDFRNPAFSVVGGRPEKVEGAGCWLERQRHYRAGVR